MFSLTVPSSSTRYNMIVISLLCTAGNILILAAASLLKVTYNVITYCYTVEHLCGHCDWYITAALHVSYWICNVVTFSAPALPVSYQIPQSLESTQLLTVMSSGYSPDTCCYFWESTQSLIVTLSSYRLAVISFTSVTALHLHSMHYSAYSAPGSAYCHSSIGGNISILIPMQLPSVPQLILGYCEKG